MLLIMKKKCFCIWVRIFVMIILPLLISFFILFNPIEKIPLSKEKITENITMVKVSENVIFSPTLKNAIRDIFNVPFDLKWYDICFVNNDTKLIYENGETDKNVNVIVNFNNNQKILTIPYGETECEIYKFNEDFTYKWGFKYTTNLSGALETSKEKFIPINKTNYIKIIKGPLLSPDVDSYAKPKKSGIIVKIILFFFAWVGIVFLILEIYKFCSCGFNKKK